MQPKFKVTDTVISGFSGKVYKVEYIVFDEEHQEHKYLCYTTSIVRNFQLFMEDSISLHREEIKLKPCPNCENKNVKIVDDNYDSDSIDQPKYYDELNDYSMTVCCSGNHCGCGMSMGFKDELEVNIKNWNNLKRCL